MTNEDVIDLYNRVRLGTPVVVLPRGRFSFFEGNKDTLNRIHGHLS
jgi:hypothetical protein